MGRKGKDTEEKLQSVGGIISLKRKSSRASKNSLKGVENLDRDGGDSKNEGGEANGGRDRWESKEKSVSGEVAGRNAKRARACKNLPNRFENGHESC